MLLGWMTAGRAGLADSDDWLIRRQTDLVPAMRAPAHLTGLGAAAAGAVRATGRAPALLEALEQRHDAVWH
jgi:hypothetical protein